MAGIYIHVPYCRQACHYCNFHFSTRLDTLPEYLKALHTEIARSQEFLKGHELNSIYLGGGTPSILSPTQWTEVFDRLKNIYSFSKLNEVTIEMNPEDVSASYISDILGATPIDRVSLGVQSMDDQVLQWMNRSHDSSMALDAIHTLKSHGIENISCDLMFGYPGLTSEAWQSQIQKLIDLDIPHISHYGLTVEPKTVFAYRQKNGIQIVDDEALADQMLQLYSVLQDAGYRNYELSNSARPGYEAVHNAAYWKGLPYLGLGPAAHSYDGHDTRILNIENTPSYIDKITEHQAYQDVEILSATEIYEEYLMTHLRTDVGISWDSFVARFGKPSMSYLISKMQNQPQERYILTDRFLKLTYEGWIWSDAIFVDLFD